MPSAISPASIDLAIALGVAEVAARQKVREEQRTHVEEWRPERESLASFLPAVFKTDAGQPAYPPPHLQRIIEVIEDDGLGDTVIIAPPGSAKTNTLVAACDWWLGQDPNQHIGYFSNTDRQAYRRSVAVRDVITRSQAYQSIFPDILPDFRKGWAEFEWFLQRLDVADKDASFMAAGVGSAIQGSRLDRALLDDIADKKNMATELQREKVIEWLRDQVMSRMAPVNRKIMICTRWHEADPAAWAIAQGWRVIRLKAVDEGRSYWPSRWPIVKLACPDGEHGQADEDWQPSEEMPEAPCWIDRDTDSGHVLHQGNCALKTFGTRAFNLTYQGEVESQEGALFERRWWRYYQALPAKAVRGGIFIDTATDDKSTGDPFAMATWRTDGLNTYLIKVFNRQIKFPDQRREVLYERERSKLHEDDPGLPVYIEEVAWALPLIDDLKGVISRVQGVKPGGHSKYARAMAASPFAEAGNLYLPARLPTETQAEYVERCGDIDAFVTQHAVFPDGSHDDMVDTTSLMANRLLIHAYQQRRQRPEGRAVEYVDPAPGDNRDKTRTQVLRESERRGPPLKTPQLQQHRAPARGGM